jgi:AraC-like DNA-binding protein
MSKGKNPTFMRTSTDKAIDYIKTNWRRGETLKEVASRFKVDPGNLDRAFRNRYGKTVKAFLDEQRKLYVEQRLRENCTFGYEIANEIGFPTDVAFYRWVRRVYGVSYNEVRRRCGRSTG